MFIQRSAGAGAKRPPPHRGAGPASGKLAAAGQAFGLFHWISLEKVFQSSPRCQEYLNPDPRKVGRRFRLVSSGRGGGRQGPDDPGRDDGPGVHPFGSGSGGERAGDPIRLPDGYASLVADVLKSDRLFLEFQPDLRSEIGLNPRLRVSPAGAPERRKLPARRRDLSGGEVGREIGRRGGRVVCGGYGGVMEGACRGAAQEGGRSLGVLLEGRCEGNRGLTERVRELDLAGRPRSDDPASSQASR
jgi:hypothetical protein